MIVPYLPTDKTIISENGKFRIKEVDEGYELWDDEADHWLLTCDRINDFREEIGKVIRTIQ